MTLPGMAHSNPNTIGNFSRSWQRATHFRELDLQSDVDIFPPEPTDDEKGNCLRFEPEYPRFLSVCEPNVSVASSPTNYGTIIHGSQSPRSASTHLADIMARVEKSNAGEHQHGPVGGSTVPMTIFNCTNMLVGVGTLSLAMGLHESGWILGLILLTLPVPVTIYTAKLLVRCLNVAPSASTYGDIAYLAFGSLGRHLIEILFTSELIAANAALFILFADSLGALAPSLAPHTCKIMIAIIMVPLNFCPFRMLSIVSAMGIFCFVGILTTAAIAGSIKPNAPGSLQHLASTSALPCNWKAALSGLGIFMAPWGGHSIIPAVYRDMRHPQKYPVAIKYTYSICYTIALSTAVIGYLMFGDAILPEVTSSILSVPDYPPAVSAIILLLVSSIPLTKISLNNRPVIDTLNKKLGISSQKTSLNHSSGGEHPARHYLAQLMLRLASASACNMLELALALMIPNFGDVVALLGSGLCIAISVVLPGSFYLIVSRHHQIPIEFRDRVQCWALIVIGSICAVAGTLSTILTI